MRLTIDDYVHVVESPRHVNVVATHQVIHDPRGMWRGAAVATNG